MSALYNEIDAYPAQWLRNLIAAGHIAPGAVDQRSIAELQPEDVRGATQAHFFAGIGVWSAALRDAGWPDDRPVWTGSCPCQPFSDAGRGRGTSDDRHLWPEWFRIIHECRPPAIFIEQVASRAGLGWLDAVFADLEGAGYACAAADLPACGVGAPHKRSRLFGVAYADGQSRGLLETRRGPGRADAQAGWRGEAQRMAYDDASGRREHESLPQPRAHESDAARSSDPGSVADCDIARLEIIGEQQARGQREATERGCTAGELVNPSIPRSGRDAGAVPRSEAKDDREWGDARRLVDVPRSAGATRGFWADADWLLCRDGKARPVKSGIEPLVNGTPRGVVRNRAAKLKGYGNAIVRQAAAAFIRAAMRAA